MQTHGNRVAVLSGDVRLCRNYAQQIHESLSQMMLPHSSAAFGGLLQPVDLNSTATS